jgi:hypothetical protein
VSERQVYRVVRVSGRGNQFALVLDGEEIARLRTYKSASRLARRFNKNEPTGAELDAYLGQEENRR